MAYTDASGNFDSMSNISSVWLIDVKFITSLAKGCNVCGNVGLFICLFASNITYTAMNGLH